MNHMGHKIRFENVSDADGGVQEAILKRLEGRELPDLEITVYMPQDADLSLILSRRFVLGGELKDSPDRILEKITESGFSG